MTEVDSADALLGDDDSDDRDDYNLGKEEEAKLLYGDDGDEDLLQGDLLEEEEEEDSHRDKFASERQQTTNAINEHENTIITKSVNWENRDNHHQQRYNRGRGGGRGNLRGRGRGGGYNNGPGRIAPGKCYVNPQLLQGAKKPVQSVPPWSNPPRGYEPERIANNPAPYGGQQRFHQQQVQCQPQQYNNQMNIQPFGQQHQHGSWQPPPQQQQQQPYPPVQQNFYEGPMQQPMQQCYPPAIPQNAQPQPFNQPPQHYPNQPQQQQQQQNSQPHYNANANFFQYPPQQQNMNPAPYNQQPMQNVHIPHQTPQHAPNHMQHSQQHPPTSNNPYYEPFQPNHNFNNPPQRPALLQAPIMLSHEGGQFIPQQRVQQQHRPHQPFRPRQPQQQFTQNQNYGQRGNHHQRGHHGNFHHHQHQPQQQQHYNNRQPYKRRNDNWHGEQNIGNEYPKRRSWNNKDNDEYYGEEEFEEQDQQQQQQETTGSFQEDPSPEIEEDEETKAYRLEIEKQKREREEYLAEKERKRKLAIMKRTGQVSDIPALQASPPKEQPRPKLLARMTGVNPNLRVLTRSDGEKVEIAPAGSVPLTITKVKIKAGVAPTNADNLTPAFFSTRKVLAKDGALVDTPVVIVRNLAASSTEPQLRKLCHGVGLVQSLEMSSKERHAKIRFKSVASAHAFYKKYQRHMLDLSMIQVELVPEKKSET